MHGSVVGRFFLLALICFSAFSIGCAHRLGPKKESASVARKLGLGECTVSATMRRYEVLDYADLLGNPNLADSSEWATATSMVQPGDRYRHVHCYQTGENYFGLFRGNRVLFRFGRMIYD